MVVADIEVAITMQEDTGEMDISDGSTVEIITDIIGIVDTGVTVALSSATADSMGTRTLITRMSTQRGLSCENPLPR